MILTMLILFVDVAVKSVVFIEAILIVQLIESSGGDYPESQNTWEPYSSLREIFMTSSN